MIGFELVKTLAEEPAKRKKILIFYIRMVLASIVANKFYIHYFEQYTVLNPFNKEFFPKAFDFFVSGKVLVVGFLYVLCHFLLFELLSMIPPFVLHTFTRGKREKMQFDNGVLAYQMRVYGVIHRNKNTKNVSVGRNFDEFYNEILHYQDSITKDEVYSYKNSLLFEILTTYFIATIVFYCCTTIDLPLVLDFVFIAGLIFIVFFYVNLCFLINIFERNSEELINLLHTLKIEEVVITSLKQFEVTFFDNKKNPGVFFSKTVTINRTNKLLHYYRTNLDLSSQYIQAAIQAAEHIKIPKIILVTNKNPTEKAEQLIQENKELLTIVKFTTENDLRIQLMKHLYDQ